jgi:hypothetical protein
VYHLTTQTRHLSLRKDFVEQQLAWWTTTYANRQIDQSPSSIAVDSLLLYTSQIKSLVLAL